MCFLESSLSMSGNIFHQGRLSFSETPLNLAGKGNIIKLWQSLDQHSNRKPFFSARAQVHIALWQNTLKRTAPELWQTRDKACVEYVVSSFHELHMQDLKRRETSEKVKYQYFSASSIKTLTVDSTGKSQVLHVHTKHEGLGIKRRKGDESVVPFTERIHLITIRSSIYRWMQGQNTGSWCWTINLTADSKQWKLNNETPKLKKNVAGSLAAPF